MKRKAIGFLLLITILLTFSVALANAGGLSLDLLPKDNHGSSKYMLTRIEWQFDGDSTGGGYVLFSPALPELRGLTGCCCEFLPYVLKDAVSGCILIP